MNAQTPKVDKPVTPTPDKVAKLLGSVISKLLTGERQGHFYESLRKWDRHENPFINFTQICTNYLIDESQKYVAFIREMEELRRKNFTINTLFKELAGEVSEYDKNHVYTQVIGDHYEVVSVHILDILDSENRRNTLTYENFIDIAQEYNLLFPCNLFNGFRALKMLNESDVYGSYFISIPKPIIIKDNQTPVIPWMRRWMHGTPYSKIPEWFVQLDAAEVNIVFDPAFFNMVRPRIYTHAFGHIHKDSKIIMLKARPDP